MTACISREPIRPGAGVADSVVIERLRKDCLAAINSGQPIVQIDLQEVRQANTKLVACLLLVLRAARSAGVRLTVHMSQQVRTWLRVCAVESLFRRARQESGDPGGDTAERHVHATK